MFFSTKYLLTLSSRRPTMSAVQRLPMVAGTLTFGASLAAIAGIPALRYRFTDLLSRGATGKMLRLLVVAYALLNLKNLPFMWHVRFRQTLLLPKSWSTLNKSRRSLTWLFLQQWRVFKGLIYQIFLQKQERTPRDLFVPMITSSFNTPYDCDYNLHKSNSTYFADLDVARAHYMGSVIRTGLQRLNAGDEEGLPAEVRAVKGKYYVALGAIGCFFQREIAPLQSFEVYTRILSWDRKWLYLVSHVVKKGAIKPDSYVLQPWKKGKRDPKKSDEEEDLKKYVYATSIARYVMKKGRLTVNPEIILERSRLLPRRPAGVGLPPRTEDSVVPTAAEGTPTQTLESRPELIAEEVDSKLGGAEVAEEVAEDESWTWEMMEAERLRGLKMASHFDQLSGIHDEIRAGEVLGQYSDWF